MRLEQTDTVCAVPVSPSYAPYRLQLRQLPPRGGERILRHRRDEHRLEEAQNDEQPKRQSQAGKPTEAEENK